MVNYYETLKVSPKASKTEIRSAYRRLARKLHPDKNNGSEETARAFAAIAEAYEVLSNAKERSAYDRRILQAQYNGSTNGDSVFASSNSHARRWRQMVYEHRYNEIIDRMIAEERRESMALQRIIFPTVALFLSTLLVAIFKPQVISVKLGIPGVIILGTLFIVGLIHLIGRIREALERYAYHDYEIHDSIMEARDTSPKPYSRFLAGSFLILGVIVSFSVGLLIANFADPGSFPSLFWLSNPEFLLYPPIFVLLVDLMHSIASRTEY
jgi:curved DNA-binding protein CbpA